MSFFGGFTIEGKSLLVGNVPGRKGIALYEEKPGNVTVLAYVTGEDSARVVAQWLEDLARSNFKEQRHFLITLPEQPKETK